MKKYLSIKYIPLLLVILVFLFVCVHSYTYKKKKYIVVWVETDESGRKGHVRHNGISTDSGYVFYDTVYNHELKKTNVLKTIVNIYKP